MRISFTVLFMTLLSSSSVEAIKVLQSGTNDSEQQQMAQANAIVEAALQSTASSLSDSASKLTTETQPNVYLNGEQQSSAESATERKIDQNVGAEVQALAKAPNGRPNGPITIIDAHRSIHQGNPQLNAQLQQSVTLLNQLLSAMMGGGSGLINQQAMMA